MATPALPGMSAAPAAAPSAPAAAPSAPAPSSPAAPPAGAATPSTPAAPEAGQQPGTPAPAAAAAPAPPNKDDFEGDVAGYLTALHKFRQENPEADDAAAAAVKTDAAADPAAPAPVEADKPADPNAPPVEAAKPEAPVTPAKVAEWMQKYPEFSQLVEGNPELKGELFAMGRQIAKAAPIMDIVATPEEARFAVDTANTFVGLRSSFMMAIEDPSKLPDAMDQFIDQFRIKGSDGKYVMDGDGNPQLADDFHLLANELVGGYHGNEISTLKSQVESLKKKISTSVYPNEFAKTKDQKALDDAEYAIAAFEYVDGFRKGTIQQEQRPQLPADATPEIKAWFEQENNRLQEREDALKNSQKENSKEARQQKRQQFESSMTAKWGGGVGRYIDAELKTRQGNGEFIPQWILQEKYSDPRTGAETNVSAFAMRVLNGFNKKVNAIPAVQQKLAELQMLQPGQEAAAAREAFYEKLRQDYLPDIFNAEVSRIQDHVRKDQSARAEHKGAQPIVATPEPRSGASPMPQVQSDAQLRTVAKENAKKVEGYDSMDPTEKLATELSELNKLRRQGTARK